MNCAVDNPITEGDFPTLTDYCEIPIFSENAWRCLEPLIGPYCEALPLLQETGKKLWFIHILNHLDALDENRSLLNRNSITGRVSRVFKYAFRKNIVNESPIFMLPLKSGSDLLVNDRFKDLVELNKLSGLRLLPIETV